MTAPELSTALPGDTGRTRLPERVVPYWRAQTLLLWVPITIAAVVGAVLLTGVPGPLRGLLVLAPLAIGATEIVLITPKRRTVWWYEIGEEQIDLEHGWFIRTRTVIPMTRVQHVELQRGPLADRFDLAQLEIHTAAGSVTIPALDRADGDRIRQRIADLARIADDL